MRNTGKNSIGYPDINIITTVTHDGRLCVTVPTL
jgi:hypothetical protein